MRVNSLDEPAGNENGVESGSMMVIGGCSACAFIAVAFAD